MAAILVIGGTRFVGYQLVWRLLAQRHRVSILNRGTTPDPFGDRIDRLIADRTTADFARVLAGRSFDAAVDFAAYTAADARGVVATLAGHVGHYVFISSGQVYLVREGCPTPARESDYDGRVMAAPSDLFDRDNWQYGVDKREAEDVLADAWNTRGFPATRLRIPMVNGERDHFQRIDSYVWRLLDGGPILLPDGGTGRMRHVYSGDVVRVVSQLLGNPATFGEVYNVAQDDTPTLAELVMLLAELLGARAELVTVSSAALAAVGLRPIDISPFSDPWMSNLDASKAKRALGYQPTSVRHYAEMIVACVLNGTPVAPPVNYGHRSIELRLADASTAASAR